MGNFRLELFTMKRNIAKGAIELVPVIGIIVVGYFLDNAADLGIGASGTWALLQIRRALRDVTQGAPA
jgi:hypothetical protein